MAQVDPAFGFPGPGSSGLMPFLPSFHRRLSGCLPTFHSVMKSFSSLRPDQRMSTLQKSKWQLRPFLCVWQVWARQVPSADGRRKPEDKGVCRSAPGCQSYGTLCEGCPRGCKVHSRSPAAGALPLTRALRLSPKGPFEGGRALCSSEAPWPDQGHLPCWLPWA